MSLWSMLFGPPTPKPVQRIDNTPFGTLVWSDDDNAWLGECGRLATGIGYTRTFFPEPSLIDYACELLGPEGAHLISILDLARKAHADQFAAYSEEFSQLKIEHVHFFQSKTGMCCLVDLAGGRRDRTWRAEFEGERCLGFGFDT